ncbi:MAG: hypothetical protein IPL65_22635 [Lewinellaceae bacterium]|nr:hypothetical protein [Lewinellaceae bacterium]
MKTSNWILWLGIVTIVLGVNGISNGFFAMLMFNTGGSTEPSFVCILNTAAIFRSAFFVLAGVFFLLKRAISWKIMLAALLFSLFYFLASWLVFALKSGEFFPINLFNIFGLLGPAIDLLLLLILFRIQPYYPDQPQQQVWLFSTGAPTESTLKWATAAGILCVLIPASLFVIWVSISNSGLSHEESSALFDRWLPAFLRPRFRVNYLSLALALGGVVFSILGLKLNTVAWRLLNMTVLVASILLLSINLFSMM